jgi:hypothetical protein
LLNIANVSSSRLSADQHRFVDEWAALLAAFAVPLPAGRLYGYLLLRPTPASLDDIVCDLALSKGSASVTTRLLEKHGLAIRHSVPGTKRALYSAPSSHSGLILEHAKVLGSLGRMLQKNAPVVASGAVAERLGGIAEFYLAMRDAHEAAVHEFEASVRNEPAKSDPPAGGRPRGYARSV